MLWRKFKEYYDMEKLIRSLRKRNIGISHKGGVDELSTIGDYTFIGMYSFVTKANIGRYTSIASYVQIGPGEHRLDWISTNYWPYRGEVNWLNTLTEGECNIGNDVWIGANSVIRRGVTIGDGAVIGACSFVNTDVEPFAIYAGVPAKFIRYRFSEDIIKNIMDSKWWELDLVDAKKKIKEIEMSLKK